MTPEQDAHQHLTATLQHLEAIVGRPLTDEEVAVVLTLIAGYHDLLTRGHSPEVVASIARREADTVTTLH